MSEPVMQRLKISREGVILIKSFEGFRPRALRRDDGKWVIGYGHTLSAREGATVSEADAELLLQYDLIPVAASLNQSVTTPLNQHQFDALASFVHSVGVEAFEGSDVLQRINDGASGLAADALIAWPSPAPLDSPQRRRAAERALFVADPTRAITLSDLLSAPLPPPPVAAAATTMAPALETISTPDIHTAVDADAETPTTVSLGEPDAAEPMDAATAVEAPSDEAALSASDDTPDAEPSTTSELMEAPGSTPNEPAQAEHVALAETAAYDVLTAPLDADLDAGTTPLATSGIIASSDEDKVAEVAEVAVPDETLPEPEPEPVVAPETTADIGIETSPTQDAPAPFAPPGQPSWSPRYVPFSGEMTGALPGSPFPEPTRMPAFPPLEADSGSSADPFAGAPPLAPVTPALNFPDTVSSPSAFPAPAASSFPAFPEVFQPAISADQSAGLEAPVVTPFGGDVATSQSRMVWPHHETAVDQTPLFDDDGGLKLGGHTESLDAVDDGAPRIEWRETAWYFVMGGFGLVTFGMSVAALRRAAEDNTGNNDMAIMGGVLLLVGAACVGVSAYNLYRRLGRPDAER